MTRALLRLALAWIVVLAGEGCLAFRDFEVVDDGETEPTDASGGSHCTGDVAFECENDVLYACQDGMRDEGINCRSDGRFCNLLTGKCAPCEPDARRCRDRVSDRCSASGKFEPAVDCAENNGDCDPFTGGCAPCVAGRRYCMPAQSDGEVDRVFNCQSDNTVPDASKLKPCPRGCFEFEDGQGDCISCDPPDATLCQDVNGQYALYRCPEDPTRLTLVQSCPYGCDPDQAQPECFSK